MTVTVDVFTSILFGNASWSADVAEMVSGASLDMGIDQVTELQVDVDDPNYALFKKSSIALNMDVTYQDLRLSVAVVETNAGGGEGGFALRARPRFVRLLKNRTGTYLMNNVSPSQFVASEAAAVGAKSLVQASEQRSQIARDVAEFGQQGSGDYSSWSTFGRLGSELGFVVFEVAGTIIFGKPSWLVANMPVVKIAYGDVTHGPVNIPRCTQSLDNNGRKVIEVSVPYERSNEFRPGYALDFSGIPRFDGRYLITSVKFPLVTNTSEVSISAETPYDPTPQGAVA